jgi:predicted DCC family thiol-disulfide oxidoreductase YuxK
MKDSQYGDMLAWLATARPRPLARSRSAVLLEDDDPFDEYELAALNAMRKRQQQLRAARTRSGVQREDGVQALLREEGKLQAQSTSVGRRVRKVRLRVQTRRLARALTRLPRPVRRTIVRPTARTTSLARTRAASQGLRLPACA